MPQEGLALAGAAAFITELPQTRSGTPYIIGQAREVFVFEPLDPPISYPLTY